MFKYVVLKNLPSQEFQIDIISTIHEVEIEKIEKGSYPRNHKVFRTRLGNVSGFIYFLPKRHFLPYHPFTDPCVLCGNHIPRLYDNPANHRAWFDDQNCERLVCYHSTHKCSIINSSCHGFNVGIVRAFIILRYLALFSRTGADCIFKLGWLLGQYQEQTK